ncbi:nuclear envelope integral membrane protein 2 [Pygocentrus nattereri]|uniref:Nuclear envelope integral membrane protein 2 n=1 Tax=Pygocentrus nattereri TaxID=42514 RepID=A0AAR2KIB1_PYGNA|nr:nuclear envelope integral membrane protein 2 [Pygocentrus nattereri]
MKKALLSIRLSLSLLSIIIIVLISLVEGNSRYSYADCTYVKGHYTSKYYGSRCFCYTATGIKWKDIWSTFQVSVTSSEDVYVVYPMEARNCHDPFKNILTLATCMIEPYWPSRIHKEKMLDIPLAEEEVFFMTKSPRASAEYTLQVEGQRFNWMRFFLFASGLMLFFFAGAVCRSSLFFYVSGISLGMVSVLVFLLLVLKSFIPKRGLFLVLFGAGSGLSYLGIQKMLNEGDDIMRVYWREVLGYLLVSGLVSFIFCYRHGPITNRRTLNLMTWGLQAVAMVVACHGITYAPLSWMLLTVLLCYKIVPLVWAILLGIWRQICWLLGLFRGRRHLKTRLLTEEEYREQGERHTKAALEELRKYCNNPGFPAWDTVLKLRSPQGFAEFLRSGSHVTATEQQSYEQQSHEQHFGLVEEYDEDALLNSAKPSPTLEDLSENALHSYSHSPPTPSPFNSLPALPSPPVYGGPICPYPPTPFTPLPQLPFTEDDDEPF